LAWLSPAKAVFKFSWVFVDFSCGMCFFLVERYCPALAWLRPRVGAVGK
jgi:hypothetical protein